jgi:hypothetical protein
MIYVMVEYFSKSDVKTISWSVQLAAIADVMGAPIAMTQKQREALPPEMRKSMREGAKGMFASFYFLIFLVWSLKGSLIILFLRLTYVSYL